MSKSPLFDARYPVIPEVCRRPSDCQLKNLIHDSSCQQGDSNIRSLLEL